MDVTFAVASFNSGQYLEECVNSALAQTGIHCEVIIVDDGSSDGSDGLAESLAATNDRVRFFRTPTNRGPGGARNIALNHMRGHWYAVLDSDDVLEPDRSEKLITAARAHNAQMVADDLILFGEGMEDQRFLQESDLAGDIISLDRYLLDSAMYSGKPNPGFLKPMISRDLIETTGICYDESLRVAEDDDLIIRLLMTGARYLVTKEAGYRYRKHDQSISHRLSPKHAEAMGARAKQLDQEMWAAGLDSPAFRARQGAMRRAVAFTLGVEAIKNGNYLTALSHLAKEPGSAALYSMPIKSRLARLLGR